MNDRDRKFLIVQANSGAAISFINTFHLYIYIFLLRNCARGASAPEFARYKYFFWVNRPPNHGAKMRESDGSDPYMIGSWGGRCDNFILSRSLPNRSKYFFYIFNFFYINVQVQRRWNIPRWPNVRVGVRETERAV